MSSINSQATIELHINGQQAQQKLTQLRTNALNLENAIAKAAAAGNKTDLKRLRKELSDTKKQIREMESSTMQVEGVLRRLDKATPRELNKALGVLNRQLEYIERGTTAWDAHTEKIRRVKEEISRMNSDLRVQESFWERMNRKLNDYQTALLGAAAALTGIIMAARNAVTSFAEIDDEMANVRKYTGMSQEQVVALNEELKKIDTRSSRIELNKLAEEAGRLGKTSKEDVLGFVMAADKINVALDDLGEGATLTISKLTNIFGDEERLGTEKAMLAVGSVINELSQNCTASAPYLADFSKRLAGVGAQAKMTIPEIMAFAAVLDSQGQACEMSATAMSKLTMDLFKDTEKVAKAIGVPLETLKKALDTSTNEGLLLVLQRLHDLGDLSVLAPIFADMGEDGARASSVIAALAGNVGELREQQEAANKAFVEATSVTKEFDVQNNTVQADLDKARKRVSEMAVELGEKLLPVMRYVMTSTTALLKMLSLMVDLVVKWKKEIVIATTAIVAYKVAINAASVAMKVHHGWVLLTQAAHKAATAVMATYKTAVLTLSVGFNKLTGNISRAAAAQRMLNTAQKANVFGLVAAAVTTLVVALVQYTEEADHAAKAEEHLNDMRAEAARKASEETTRIELLREAAMNEKLSLEERHRAIEDLNRIIPNYNAFLDKTTGKYRENKQALDDYISSLVRMYEIEGAKDKLKEIGRQKADIRIKRREAQQEKQKAEGSLAASGTSTMMAGSQAQGAGMTPGMKAIAQSGSRAGQEQRQARADVQRANDRIDNLDKQMQQLEADEKLIKDVYGDDMQKSVVAPPKTEDAPTVMPVGGAGNTGSGNNSNGKKNEDRFKAEKEWKEKEEALNRIAYATGKKSYEDYTLRMDEIGVEFYKKELSHLDLAETEKLTIEAEYYEAVMKMNADKSAQTVEATEKAYAAELAALKQRYVDGEMTTEVYEEAMKQKELSHLREMVQVTAEGTKERLEAEKAYLDRQERDQKERQQKALDAEKKHQEVLKKMKTEYFGDNPQERKAKLDAETAILDEVYKAEIAAAGDDAAEKLRIEEAYQKAKLLLIKKYNLEAEDESRNFLEEMNDSVVEFLDSDLGIAIKSGMDTMLSSMSSIFTQVTSLLQAELQIQQNAINKRYDAEVARAEGNRYIINRIEKRREEEIAKAKNEANRKMYSMQVMQAIASTALSAVNAYSSAAQVPMIGYILAPIAAASAVAAGMLQVAAIKKQQQASETQGYMRGGFTPSGRVDEEVGVVHAGEWVASQKLLSSPVARPIIDILDYAQRNNAIGSLSSADVSRSITAPVVMAAATQQPTQVVLQNAGGAGIGVGADAGKSLSEMVDALGRYSDTMKSLKQRLDEPFMTVNTITGEYGTEKVQQEYDILMKNKSPRKR